MFKSTSDTSKILLSRSHEEQHSDDNGTSPSSSSNKLSSSILLTKKLSTETNRRQFFLHLPSVTSAASFVMASSTNLLFSSAVATTMDAESLQYYTPPAGSLKGQVIVITGGTTGLGLESAKRLSFGGATVVVTSRNEQKGEMAVQSIRDYVASKQQEPSSPVYSITLNLDDFASVRQFPIRFRSLFGDQAKIDVLINNAGVMAIPERELTVDGYERTFQTNHLGHFLLSNLCLPFMRSSRTDGKVPRLINVSSTAYKIPGRDGLDLDNLNGERKYGPWISYGQSKLANILFTNELQKRAQLANVPIVTASLHPGAVQTDLGRYIIGVEKWDNLKRAGNMDSLPLYEKLLMNTLSKFVLTVEEGASTQIYVSSCPNLQPAGYYEKCAVTTLEPFALDGVKAKNLWELSERMTGQPFTLA